MGNYVTGNMLYCAVGAGGNGVTLPATPNYYPIVNRGSITEESEVQEIRTIGNEKPQQLREGLLRAFGNMMFMVQDTSLLGLIARQADRTLPYFNIQGGSAAVDQSHRYCKVDSMAIEFAAGAPVRASINWKGIRQDDRFAISTDQEANASIAPVWMWYDCAISCDDATIAALNFMSITVNIANGVDWLPVVTTNPQGWTGLQVHRQRGPLDVFEAGQTVTVELRATTPDTFDYQTLQLAEIENLVITVSGGGVTGGVITLSGLQRGQQELPTNPSELIEHGLRYSATAITIASL